MIKVAAIIGLVLLATHSLAREPVATTEQFAFYSDYDTNLNDALIAAGVARRFGRDELFLTGDEQACFEALAPSAQVGWRLPVDYYAEVVSPHGFMLRPSPLQDAIADAAKELQLPVPDGLWHVVLKRGACSRNGGAISWSHEKRCLLFGTRHAFHPRDGCDAQS